MWRRAVMGLLMRFTAHGHFRLALACTGVGNYTQVVEGDNEYITRLENCSYCVPVSHQAKLNVLLTLW